ncbi:MAG: 3-dehydroquinate synthase [Pseudomonadota bacterium]|nr:3-dehydroquinate synthase [Pseudomonadota bacterium]MDE3037637.1 3-dehydroquinate synthase [Pseudomonadota bacterium]
MPETLRVELGARSYDIIVGGQLLAHAGEYIAPRLKSRHVIIISDETVAKLYLHRLTSALEEKNIGCRPVIVAPGERTKSLEAFSGLMETLLEQKPDREATLIALGGGVVGDLAGFAASVLLRGVDFIQMPTTLLSQVDSSVGGKTGINSRFGKNLIGSFHQPILVLSDVSALATLPKREWLAGYAEMLKYGLISDAGFFAWLEKNAGAMLAGDAKLLTYAIVRSCAAKAAIIAEDEREGGVRALLNFGHTFAHAFEAETGYSDTLLHGEAVAIGIILAFRLSVALGLCPEADLKRILSHYEATRLPASPLSIRPKWNIDALMEHFTRDKKTKDGKFTFILTRGIGKAFIAENIEKDFIRAWLS